jgi:hypothetical protein
MTIKVKIMGNIVTKNGAKHINEIQEFTDKDFSETHTFVNYITYMLRTQADFLGLVYFVENN